MERKDIEEMTVIKETLKQHSNRLDEHDKKINALSDVYVALTKVDDKVNNIDTDVKEIKSDLKDMKEKPIKRYDGVITTIISVIATALVTYVLVKLGLK